MDRTQPIVLAPGAVASLENDALLAVMKRISAGERMLTAYALIHLGEILRRKSYEDAGYPTMFAYCVGELHYSEPTAYRRAQAAAAANDFPEVLTMIKEGGLTVCSLSIIARHLTPENGVQLLRQIEGKSARAVLRLAAELKPLPDTRDFVRSARAWLPPAVAPQEPPTEAAACADVPPIPTVEPAGLSGDRPTPSTLPPPAIHARPIFSQQIIMPRSPGRIHFGFTGSEELLAVIERCTELLWHKHPSGRLEDVILEVGKAYLSTKDPELLPSAKPRPRNPKHTRTIARWVRSIVYRRDGGRCAFLSSGGRRCEARRALEYDHILPWSKGGRSDDPSNVRLLCRAHNRWAAKAEGLA